MFVTAVCFLFLLKQLIYFQNGSIYVYALFTKDRKHTKLRMLSLRQLSSVNENSLNYFIVTLEHPFYRMNKNV